MAQFFYSVIMAIYVLYLTHDLGLSAASVGLIFGLGRTLVLTHLLFVVFGIFLAFTVVWRTYAALLVFVSEFAQLAVNAVYMGQPLERGASRDPAESTRTRSSESHGGPCGFGKRWGSCWVASWANNLGRMPRSWSEW